MAPKWLNMHGSIVSYPGRVFGDDLAILGYLEASLLFSPDSISLGPYCIQRLVLLLNLFTGTRVLSSQQTPFQALRQLMMTK